MNTPQSAVPLGFTTAMLASMRGMLDLTQVEAKQIILTMPAATTTDSQQQQHPIYIPLTRAPLIQPPLVKK